MAQKSEGRENFNHHIYDTLSNLPDPLHFELPYAHKRILELVYFIILAAAIISILMLNSAGTLTVSETNASVMVILVLGVIMGIMLVVKSSIVHKPSKSSS